MSCVLTENRPWAKARSKCPSGVNNPCIVFVKPAITSVRLIFIVFVSQWRHCSPVRATLDTCSRSWRNISAAPIETRSRSRESCFTISIFAERAEAAKTYDEITEFPVYGYVQWQSCMHTHYTWFYVSCYHLIIYVLEAVCTCICSDATWTTLIICCI
jgi:hypothetical protein